jgi:2-octaprenyl-6-methoxyphenol hydroxylase
MITALSLAKNKIKVTIIETKDTEDKNFFDDIRTTALTDYSKNYLDTIGIWDSLKEFSGPICDIYVADNKALEMLHFDSKALHSTQIMGYLIQNNDFKKTLLSLVKCNSYINIIDKTTYTDIDNTTNGCCIKLSNNEFIETRLLIVCDGYNSKARQNFFRAQMIKHYGQNALTFIAKHEQPHESVAVEHFMPSGPFAILPLKDQYRSSIVWTTGTSQSNALMNLEVAEFTFLIQENFGPFLGEVEIVSKIESFSLKAYHTEKYFNKSIVLVADTAHIIHPLAGQGLNQGIKDIESLVSAIETEEGDLLDNLANYEQSRKNDNSNMLALTDILNTLFSNHSKLLHTARQIGFKSITTIPHARQALIKYAMGKR